MERVGVFFGIVESHDEVILTVFKEPISIVIAILHKSNQPLTEVEKQEKIMP